MELKRYAGHGLRFDYPADWQLTEEEQEGEWTVSLQTPGTAFWSATILPDAPEPDDVMEAALDAYRSEYPNVDIYRREELIADGPSASVDLEFVCFDWVAYAALRAVQGIERTLLVLYQGNDLEGDEVRDQLDDVTKSLAMADSLSGGSDFASGNGDIV